MTNIADPLVAAYIRCYETFPGGAIAFEHNGELCFGPQTKLSPFLSGSTESFLVGEAAQAAIAELRGLQGQSRFQSATTGSDNDSLVQIRKRWDAERSAGQWEPAYIREQLKGLH
jgi:hypothetical protein